MVENLDDCVDIFGARFPYVKCHFRPASQSIKIFATRFDIVRASSRAALSSADFTEFGFLAGKKCTASRAASFAFRLTQLGVAFDPNMYDLFCI